MISTKEYNGEPARYAHAKRDGYCVELRKNASGQVSFWTRKPLEIDLSWHPAYRNAVIHMPTNEVVWGELWIPGHRASDVKTAIIERWLSLQWHAFALPQKREDLSLEAVRDYVMSWGLRFLEPYFLLEHCTQSDLFDVKDPDLEGWVFKDGNLLNWRKWKPVRTATLRVVDVKWSTAETNLGLIGAIICADSTGRIVAACSGMKRAERIEMSDNNPIGRIVEVKYQYVGNKGRLRHPRFDRFREDLNCDSSLDHIKTV